jgi:hypothetical protein
MTAVGELRPEHESPFLPAKARNSKHRLFLGRSIRFELVAQGFMKVDEVLFVLPRKHEILGVDALGECILANAGGFGFSSRWVRSANGGALRKPPNWARQCPLHALLYGRMR